MKDLYSLNLSENTREQTNPFTGESIDVPLDYGLSVEEKRELRDYFRSLGGNTVDENGFRHIRLAENDNIRFRDYGLLEDEKALSAIAFEYENINYAVAEILFYVISKFNVVIRSGPDSIAHAKEIFPKLAEKRWENIEKMESPEDVLDWLNKQPGYF